MAIGGTWWLTKKSHNKLATASAVHLVLVTLFNFCGLYGVLHIGCCVKQDHGFPFYVVWIVSSFITNLLLQKIVLLRARLMDDSKILKTLERVFHAEVILAVLFFIFSLVASVSWTVTNSEGTDPNVLRFLALITIASCLLFVLFDFVFSIVASIAMYNGLKKAQAQVPYALQGHLSMETGGLIRWSTSLDRAVFFAKVNLLLVVASVVTSSLFYLTLITFAATSIVSVSREERLRRVAIFFVMWVLDSLFNDACVVFVGFGPTSNALNNIKEAVTADIVGAPTSEISTQEHQVVQGIVLGTAASTSLQEPSADEALPRPQ
eukprot:gnl/MRDRNA2_/MRDRNA2_25040_c0_seq1.p1 gnl/MRDRNA2_/MRDRNA2_25040_c0~~gnl/MRDRNA2_/MRDRNA2_25040_c0_seq1.p1  ORF type:complete len:347 (+),score=39.17 gnl/MRDRNA2_/MRDRNA2_25040_c0_seq1:79-1041(+)